MIRGLTVSSSPSLGVCLGKTWFFFVKFIAFVFLLVCNGLRERERERERES